MSAAKKQAPRKLVTVLRLEAELAAVKADLREAKKALKHRDEQLAFMTKAAQGNAEHAEALQEVLASAKTMARQRHLGPLLKLLDEWSPS